MYRCANTVQVEQCQVWLVQFQLVIFLSVKETEATLTHDLFKQEVGVQAQTCARVPGGLCVCVRLPVAVQLLENSDTHTHISAVVQVCVSDRETESSGCVLIYM